jgi:FKBP-type peptidyl-prolyl cis-trans isomerase FkpA
MIKKSVIAVMAVAAFAFVACGPVSPWPGYQAEQNGTWFTQHKQGSGTETVEVGGAIFIKIKFKDAKDSIFIDVNKESHSPSYPMRMDSSEFAGDFLDIMSRLHVGDSVSFFVKMDSLKKYYPDEFVFDAAHDTMDYLGFTVAVDSIYKKAKVDELQTKAAAERQKQQEMMMKIQAVMMPIQQKADSISKIIKKKDATMLKPYLAAHNITAKPDENGIYYQELTPGTGVQLMPGMIVSLRYKGMYLDGTIFDTNTLVEGQDPMTFRLGLDPMMPGFTNSVLKMKDKGKSVFILPPAQGYNDSLTRVFEVEITDAKPMQQ